MPFNEHLKIKAGFNVPKEDEAGFKLYLKSVEYLLNKILLPLFSGEETDFDRKNFYSLLRKLLPIVHSTTTDQLPCAISITLLCSAEYTHGVGRFLCDMSSRWLIPGKQISLVVVRSLNFEFAANEGQHYFMTELLAEITTESDLLLIKTNLPNFIRETRLNILAVQHARHVVTLKPLSLSEKKIIIQENFASLLDRPSKEFEHNIFDQMHHLLIKASGEEKVTKIKEQMEPLLKHRPKIFDRDTFNELQRFIFLFKDSFTAIRDIKHLTRIISYQYLFRKSLLNEIAAEPAKRHLSIKIFKTYVQDDNKKYDVLGVLISLNRLGQNEIFEQRHVLKAIQTYVPHLNYVGDSYIVDHREDNAIRTLYLEVNNQDLSPISNEIIKLLRSNLSRELKSRVESVIHPIFMYRNEEETMRNILILSKQLKYVHDIPQVIVSFHQQTERKIAFTVILLRLIKPQTQNIKEVFCHSSSFLKLNDLDVKIVGLLKKKYPKEANVFEVTLDKGPFLRKDFSLDLYKARQAAISEMMELFGDLRDYNGGMISKQTEVFKELTKLLLQLNIRNDFFLENFFYSLFPTYMQSLLSPVVLKEAFLLLLKIIDHDYHTDMYTSKTHIIQDSFICVIGASEASFRDELLGDLEQFNVNAQEFASSFVTIYDVSCLTFILRFDTDDEYQILHRKITNLMDRWKNERQCTIDTKEIALH